MYKKLSKPIARQQHNYYIFTLVSLNWNQRFY